MKSIIAVVALAVIATLTGCTSSRATSPTPPLYEAPAVSGANAGAVAGSVVEPAYKEASLGQTLAWESGIEGTVSGPRPVRVSEYHRMPGMQYLEFSVAIKNNGSGPVSVGFMMVSLQFNGVRANEIFDSANNYMGTPNMSALPGKTSTFKVCFEVPEGPGELQVEVRPGFGYNNDTAFYTGQI